MKPSVSVRQTFLLSALLTLTASLPVRDEAEMDGFLHGMRHLNAPSSLSGLDEMLQAAGLGKVERRRQLGDIEFSNRYAEFLRSKAKHSSMCALLHRLQGVRRSGPGGEAEKLNLLLKQYMCPSIVGWTSDL